MLSAMTPSPTHSCMPSNPRYRVQAATQPMSSLQRADMTPPIPSSIFARDETRLAVADVSARGWCSFYSVPRSSLANAAHPVPYLALQPARFRLHRFIRTDAGVAAADSGFCSCQQEKALRTLGVQRIRKGQSQQADGVRQASGREGECDGDGAPGG
jgi:hypothetical protein